MYIYIIKCISTLQSKHCICIRSMQVHVRTLMCVCVFNAAIHRLYVCMYYAYVCMHVTCMLHVKCADVYRYSVFAHSFFSRSGVCVCVFKYVCLHVFMYACVCVRICACVHVSVSIHTSTLGTCMYMYRVHVCTLTYMYMHVRCPHHNTSTLASLISGRNECSLSLFMSKPQSLISLASISL